MRSISAGKFKDICLGTLDEVAATRTPVVITKWGRPVARLVPVIAPPSSSDAGSSGGGAEETVAPYGRATARAGEDAAGRLQRVAAELGVPPETLLRKALDAYVGDSALDHLIERARRPVGAFRSGRVDLAEKHDEALGEILGEEMERRQLPE